MRTKVAMMILIVMASVFAGCTGDTDSADETIIEDVYGCTNPDALNYNENATKDDTSCTFDSDTGELQDNLEADDCSNSIMNNTDTPVTEEDVQEEYNFSEMLEPMGVEGANLIRNEYGNRLFANFFFDNEIFFLLFVSFK